MRVATVVGNMVLLLHLKGTSKSKMKPKPGARERGASAAKTKRVMALARPTERDRERQELLKAVMQAKRNDSKPKGTRYWENKWGDPKSL